MSLRKLKITAVKEIYKGTNANGTEYTIHQIGAIDTETGITVNVPLRSFDPLEEGEVGEFSVEKYERPGKDTTFTLKKNGGRTGAGGGGNGGGNGGALAPKLEELRDRVEILEDSVSSLQKSLTELVHSFEPQPVAVGDGGSSDDEEVPY